MELDEEMTRTVRVLTDRAIQQHRGHIPYALQRLRTHLELAQQCEPDPEPGPDLIGVAEAAHIIGVHPSRVRRIARDLDGQRPGRDWTFHRTTVEQYAAARAEHMAQKQGKPER